jgi:L-arabinonolactonase
VIEIKCLVEAKDILGEGVIWNVNEQALYWCDNLKSNIQRYDPATGKHRVWPMPEEVGSFVFRKKGGLCAAMKSGFAFIDDLDNLEVSYIIDPEPNSPQTRMNDGKCDRRGRFWCGSMDANLKDPLAALYKLEPNLTCHKMDDGIICSNGMAWSPDDKTMYFADTRAESVFAYDYDINDGTISNKRIFISTADMPGRTDGATVDVEGNYWFAHIHGSKILKYDPAGNILQAIDVPVIQPTMCTFGGKGLDVLYVTSATKFMQPGEDKIQPLAGSLFAIYGLGAQGIAEPLFGG